MKETNEGDLDTSYEAMDIDQSQNSVRDISDDDQIIDTVDFEKLSSKKANTILAYEQTSTKPKKKRKRTVNSNLKRIKRFNLNVQNSRNIFSKSNIFVILVAVCAIFIYISMSLECCDMLDLHHIDETLKSKLYGQSVAIKSIIAAFSSKIPIKILFFYGGTGVGKTYTSSLIFNRLCQCSNIYHYTGPTFWHTYSNNLMFGYSFCKSSIIIIDDLTFNDAEFPYHIKAIIEKSQNLNKNLTIILLYNSDAPKEGFVKYKDLVFGKNLMKIYSHIEVQKYFIQFKEITSDTLQKCIENELNGKRISNVLMKNIIEIFNASSDGCKNVYSKVKYLNLS